MSGRLKVFVSFLALVNVVVVGLLGSIFALRRIALSARPESRQRKLLACILRQNATSEYGRERGFSSELCTPDAFLERHPIVDYEGIRDWVERSVKCNRNLLAEVDLFRISMTSGTTGLPKAILQSRSLYRLEYLEYTLAVLFRILLADHRSLMRPLGIIVAASDGKRIGAVASASAANTLYCTSPFRRFAALPPILFELEDADARYYYYGLFMAACQCRCVITPNPTTILEVLDSAIRHEENFFADLRLQQLSNRFGLSDIIWRQIEKAWLDLAAWSSRPRSLFDEVRTIVTWTGGSCGFFARRLTERLPNCRVLELGYLATDSPICVPIGMDSQVLASNSVFAEFLPVEDGEARICRYSELEQGKLYEIVITNRYGLYRYAMRDIVRVSGKVFGSPCLEFVRKTSGFSNITGEKLSEDQVCAALSACESAFFISIDFFVVIPDLEICRYDVFCELASTANSPPDTVISEHFDSALCKLNIEYRSKRSDGRLRPPNFEYLVANAGTLYKRKMLAHGARDVQFKVRHLQPDDTNREFLRSMIL